MDYFTVVIVTIALLFNLSYVDEQTLESHFLCTSV